MNGKQEILNVLLNEVEKNGEKIKDLEVSVVAFVKNLNLVTFLICYLLMK